MGPPTLSGFQAFLLDPVGITATILPPSSFVVAMALTVAMDIVNQQLQLAAPTEYTLAVYNLATSNIFNYAQDLPGAAIYRTNSTGIGQPFFAAMRDTWGIYNPTSGVVQSASDVSTSDTVVVPDFAKDLTLADLQLRKDPFGRQYLALAQKYGTLWGIN